MSLSYLKITNRLFLKYPIWPLVLALGLVSLVYSKPFFSPNSYFFNAHGDALKNYYTFDFHVKNGRNPFQFKGMNYPFGDNIFYPDSQPILSIPLKYFVFLHPYTIGIHNWLLLCSLVVGVLFLYLILRKFGLPIIEAGLIALGIQMIAPQLNRLGGHFGLAYSCFIPMGWYLLLAFWEKSNKTGWSFLIATQVLFWFLVHPYLGLILVAFYFFYWLIKILFSIVTRNFKISEIKYFSIQCLLPVVAFKLLVWGTDSHGVRAENPPGFYEYVAGFFTVFVAPNGFLRNFLVSTGLEMFDCWEGRAFIGTPSQIAIITAFIGLSWKLFRNRNFKFVFQFFNDHQIYFFGSSVLLLLYAMCIPFKWSSVSLLDVPVLSGLKQFRSIGRFAWVFFYVVGVLSFVLFFKIWQFFKNKGSSFLFKIILLAPMVILLAEGLANQLSYAKDLKYPPNLFIAENLNNETKEVIDIINHKRFQAVLPIPFFHYGSGSNSRPVGSELELIPHLISYHTNLPMFASNLPRLAIDESDAVLKILSLERLGGMENKLKENGNPVLVLFQKNNDIRLLDAEQYYLDRSEKIFENDRIEIRSMNTNVFCAPKYEPNISFEMNKDSLVMKERFWVSDTNKFFLSKYSEPQIFIDGNCKNPLSFDFENSMYKILHEFETQTLPLGDYVVSFWFMPQDPFCFGSSFILQENYKNTGEVKWIKTKRLMESFSSINGWTLFELDFTITDSTKGYTLFLNRGSKYFFDACKLVNFQIRQLPLNTYMIENTFLRNNYYFTY